MALRENKFPDPAVDYRARPGLYRIGRGETGVLTVEPYKSEILPLWRFRTPEEAEASSKAILAMFHRYGRENDFVGMDMARKFLQMGCTRARRYARHRSGRKYAPGTRVELPEEHDAAKARSAEIFRERWHEAASDPRYLELKAAHQQNVALTTKRGGA